MKKIIISLVAFIALFEIVDLQAQSQLVDGRMTEGTANQYQAVVTADLKNEVSESSNLVDGQKIGDNSILNKTSTFQELDNASSQNEVKMIDGKQVSDSEYNLFIKSNQTAKVSQNETSVQKEVYVRDVNAKPIPFPKEEYKRKSNEDKPLYPNFPKENYVRKANEN